MTSIELYEKALELMEQKKRFAFAAVVHSAGSTPQKAGANALIEAAGPIWGTLGGGCLEAESRQRALRSIDEGQPQVFDLKLDEVSGWDDGLICGGKVRVLVDPEVAKNAAAFRDLLQAVEKRQRGAFVTVISHPDHPTGSATWISQADVATCGLLPDPTQVQDRIVRERPGRLKFQGESESAPIELYVEPIVPTPKLIIAGGGHIGKATAHLANLNGFEVTVIDDRPSFASLDHIPDAHHVICGDIAKEMAAQTVESDTYIVIVTRGHRHDGAVLAACVRSAAAYIGMIGSRRKGMLIRRSLVEEGFATEEEIDRVVSPMGLEIGSESVQEIALSITAQLVSVRRTGKLDAESKNFIRHDQRNRTRCRSIDADGQTEASSALRPKHGH